MNTVVLDKTGTLTQGRPELTDFEAINGHENEVLRLVAAVEAQSEHPIAEAIVQGAKARGLELPRSVALVPSLATALKPRSTATWCK
ncbi:hypothetical protein HSBAA_PA_2000 (plasmid) [Vreelandella sulfidaeris]|uniref:Uncharacterized protein n=1 Tax=Vreelandella sulfidaeris TaxID=115553 RepID=A0A455UIN3_9GAMM|nr:hypothetical protein HSBAA_PA_2000 [Halomonas sulfidaeris]